MKEKKQSLKSKVTYVKKNWMLYIFFLMPALLLTIIFKYVPMGCTSQHILDTKL